MARSAARVDDFHVCPLNGTPPAFVPPPPHIGGPILPQGAPNIMINGHHAARVTDHAECAGRAVADDTVRGGLITVFLEGQPAARILDKTDVGWIAQGSADVQLGEWAGGALTAFQAQWLYDYMAAQQHVPFEFATDGCFARADRMAAFMESLGIDVKKQWAEARPGHELHVDIPNYEDGYQSGGVTWGWHVAPVVDIKGPNGATESMVFDPSLGFGRPVSVGEWIEKQTADPSTVDTWSGPADVYFDKAISGMTEDTMRDPTRTASDLEMYRQYRAGLPASTGRNVPNTPVHY